jgi:hypothetical protein
VPVPLDEALTVLRDLILEDRRSHPLGHLLPLRLSVAAVETKSKYFGGGTDTDVQRACLETATISMRIICDLLAHPPLRRGTS